MLAAEDVIGRWMLLSFESRGSDGAVREPLGGSVGGYVIYLEDGWFSAYIEGGGRRPFGTADPRGGTPEQVVEAFRSVIAYGGRWRLEEDAVIHAVEFSSLPDWAGGEQRRFITLEDGTLTLRTPPIVLDDVETVSVLTWRRG